MVLFGGWDGGSNRNDTWEYNGTDWTLRTPLLSPPARQGAAMAYDSARGVAVLFGGSLAGNYANFDDTWEWNGTYWTERNPPMHPSVRYDMPMVFDASRGVVMLFGGGHGPTQYNDTWEYNGVTNTWTQRTTSLQPTARFRHGLAYDSARQRTVLFGGYSDAAPYLADTWEWNGTNWTPTAPPHHPSARQVSFAMSFDSHRSKVILFGGNDANGLLGDTWEYGGTPSVHIVHPAAGEVALRDCTFRIEWTAQNISNPVWKFFLNKGPEIQFLRQLFPTPVDDGNGQWHADWLVPGDLEDGCDYDLVVKDDMTVTDDHSGFFCIVCRTVEIQRPVRAQAVHKGCSLTIRWHSVGCQTPDWQFFLDKNGVFQQQLYPTPVDEGNGNWYAVWQVPDGLTDGTDYSIVVKDDTCIVDDHSPQFAILDTIILGDMNGDGLVNGLDIQTFIQLLLNQ